MKVLKITLLLFSTILWAYAGTDVNDINQTVVDSTVNIELEVVSKLGEFMGVSMAGFSGQITNLLMLFGFMVTLFISGVSILGYAKLKGVSENIEKNRNLIFDFTSSIDHKFSDYRVEMKQEIVEEVKQQIVYGLDDAILKVQEHAYKKVEYTIDKLTDEIQQRRFHYQGLIFKVNQVRKYEYEKIMKQEIDIDDKVNQVMIAQAKYNEINNHYIPKLFSKKIEEELVPTAKKLSEYMELKYVINKLLLKVLHNNKLNYVEQTQVRDVLKDFYDWDEKIELKKTSSPSTTQAHIEKGRV